MPYTRLLARIALFCAVPLLAIAGCGDPTGVNGGSVRFVISGPSASVASFVAEEEAQGAAAATDGAVAGPQLHDNPGGSKDRDKDDDDHDHDRPRFVSANVTLASVLARNFEGVLVDVDMDLPTTVDVMQAERGRQIPLPDGDLPPGEYDQIVVVMTAVQVETEDGTKITVEPPGGGWTAVVPVCPFEVEDGATTTVSLTLSVRKSFAIENGQMRFRPKLDCEVPEEPEVEPTEG